MIGSKEKPYPGRVLISFLCDYDNKNLYIQLKFQFCSFWLLSKFGNIVRPYTAQMLSFVYAHRP